MSNYLAIATVTAGLYEILLGPVQKAVGSSATIGFNRPNGKGEDKDTNPHVNVYLYQVTPNAAFRNVDLPTRRSDGTLLKRPLTALDLHYLFTFHGKDEQLEPQLMLGAVASTLEAEPILSPQTIQSAVSAFNFLSNTDLGSQVERVRFTPTLLSLEEFSKLWSAFFQVEYRLSVAYQASVVLIENDDTAPQEMLPVQARNLYVMPFRTPVVAQVIAQTALGQPIQPILPASTLVIQGSQLLADNTQVRVGNVTVTPTKVTDTQITMPVPAGLQAGVLGLQVIQQWQLGTPPQLHSGVESNVAPLVLQPVITPGTVTDTQVGMTVNPAVQPNQRVTLLLNQVITTSPAAYTFPLPPVTAASTTLNFPITNVQGGGTKYFVRITVDGAESPVDLNTASPTFGPTVTIP